MAGRNGRDRGCRRRERRMTPRWTLLTGRERDAYRLTIAFLSGRMAERETLDWALRLGRTDAAKRFCVARYG